MQYALDTNVIIHLLHGTAAVRAARDSAIRQGAKLTIPPFVNYEILRGFFYQSAPKREAVYPTTRRGISLDNPRRLWAAPPSCAKGA